MARIESSETLVGKLVTRLNGERVKIVGLLAGGYKMAAPGDMSQGAPVSLVVLCRCRAVYRIDPKTSE